ncbi:raffinose/stachyose/melibiose transport system substrate-binding protein [Catenuloplanes nepalensis]|uniref:Raffinose/stachyose/melibiose transport system substrate-binding protein n=1 Tax=Catenuloplanes nepalensis TaxID=587533 RepID=A0ABT9MPC9_9ACTN|nr:extracellular solute-binding protein [Catenuloplanes nepalensis]MDP9793275.1 raffinose/stachyose/melibiose transport system substrate-binding protein [Catenuloplanes nepalensis]
MRISRRSLLGLAGAGAAGLALGACGAESGSTGRTIRWWHIANTDPMLPAWADMARRFEAGHPGVKIEITPLENEAFKTKLTTNIQAGDPPDIFHTWGGGVLAQQAEAGMIKDLTADVGGWRDQLIPTALDSYTIEDKVYASAVDTGMVGFWFNKELFGRAGVTAAPQTWAALLDVVRKLRAADVTPIALAGKEKWPGHYYWSYLALRIGGLDLMRQAAADRSFAAPEFVTAGTRLAELVALQPFQTGFLAAGYSTADGQAATMGNGKAAMELMGQWAPTVQNDSSAGRKGLGDKLGFFPFPAVDGGLGRITDAFGGGGGFAVGRNAPPEAVEFLRFIAQPDNARIEAKTAGVLPVVKAAQDAVTDPNLRSVADILATSTGFQLYLDQAFPPAVGQQVNDSVAELLAGKSSPEDVAEAITAAAKQG